MNMGNDEQNHLAMYITEFKSNTKRQKVSLT